MLSFADADLVRRDPAIPGLAILFDPDALVAELQAIVSGAKLSGADITYVKYRPGSSCLVGYRLGVAGSSVELYAKSWCSEAPRKQFADHAQSSTTGPLGPGLLVLPKHSIALTVFPDDIKLKGLQCLSKSETRNSLMQELFPENPGYRSGSIQSLRYWPERRYVAQLLTDAGEKAVLKFYSESRYQVPRANSQAFVSRGPLRVACELGRSNRYCVLGYEWLPGRLLRDALTQQTDFELPLNVGATLAQLHGQAPGSLRHLSAEAERARLLRVANDVAFICPRLAEQVNNLADRLASHLVQKPAMLCPIHNDFHAKQVLMDGESVAIVDLDEAGWGDPAIDIGNFIAHLELDVLRGDVHRGRVELMANALIDSYCTATGRPLPRVTILHVAARLFRRMPIHFRYHLHNWPELTELMLKRSETFLRMYLGQGISSVSDVLSASRRN